MAKLRQILTGNEARLVVNLEELFGVDIPNDSQFRQAVGQAIIDKIRERTRSGVDRNGKQFKNYSDEYAESISFKAYNKSKTDPNLRQTGEMLGFMDIIEEDLTTITIGWTDENANKAHGHITGNVGVKRDFLGLPDSDLSSIADDLQGFLGERFSESTQVTSPDVSSSVATLSQFLTGERTISNSTNLGALVRSLFDDGES